MLDMFEYFPGSGLGSFCDMIGGFRAVRSKSMAFLMSNLCWSLVAWIRAERSAELFVFTIVASLRDRSRREEGDEYEVDGVVGK